MAFLSRYSTVSCVVSYVGMTARTGRVEGRYTYVRWRNLLATNIQTIILSKDRPMQVDLLLRSIKKNASCLGSPAVLFKTSTKLYEMGYETARKEHPWAAWIKRTNDFNGFLKTFLNGLGPKYICFLVDDAVFYRRFTFRPFPWGSAYCPRLGNNCTYCYALGKNQTVGIDGDFDCTVSLDGHIYHYEEIMPWLMSETYTVPNDIESKLYHKFRPTLLYDSHSSLVGIPSNIVSTYPNRNEGGSAMELNGLYLGGKRIDLDAMDFSNVIGSHQAIPYVFYNPY